MKKLTDLLSEVFDETPKVDKHQVVEGVRNYGIVGRSLKRLYIEDHLANPLQAHILQFHPKFTQ